ncbi:MAG: M56 family metallopeptidase [Mobilitalea sp.]
MNDCVYWLMNMSIAGSIGCISILLIRKFLHIPRKYIRILWLVPIIRFLVPIGIMGRFSIMNLLSGYAVKTIIINNDMQVATSNYLQQANEYFPIVYKSNILEHLFTISFYIWSLVGGAMIISSIILYSMTRNEIKQAVFVKDNIYRSNSALTAAVYGIVHPKIILPEGIEEEKEVLIIKHEQVHINNRDNLYRWIMIITACVHWFNPFAWIMLKNGLEDIELACDEAVIRKLDDAEQKIYATVILTEASSPRFVITAFGGAKVKVRINNILNYKKITVFAGICFTLFCLLTFIILLTNAEG